MLKLKGKEILLKLLISQILLPRNTLRPIMRLSSTFVAELFLHHQVDAGICATATMFLSRGHFFLFLRSHKRIDRQALSPSQSSARQTRCLCNEPHTHLGAQAVQLKFYHQISKMLHCGQEENWDWARDLTAASLGCMTIDLRFCVAAHLKQILS